MEQIHTFHFLKFNAFNTLIYEHNIFPSKKGKGKKVLKSESDIRYLNISKVLTSLLRYRILLDASSLECYPTLSHAKGLN